MLKEDFKKSCKLKNKNVSTKSFISLYYSHLSEKYDIRYVLVEILQSTLAILILLYYTVIFIYYCSSVVTLFHSFDTIQFNKTLFMST